MPTGYSKMVRDHDSIAATGDLQQLQGVQLRGTGALAFGADPDSGKCVLHCYRANRAAAGGWTHVPLQLPGHAYLCHTVATDAGEAQVLEAAKADSALAPQLEGKTIRKVIFVPGRMLNLVVG